MTPDARALLIKRKTLGADDLVDKILSPESSVEKDLYEQALVIHQSPIKKSYVEACLLASNDVEEIGTLLEMSTDIIVLYSRVFYDVVGLDRLSKLELVQVKDKNEQMMKMWALSCGLPFIAWRLGGMVNVNPIDGLKELFTMCIYKSKEGAFNANDTGASSEATKWVALSLNIARLLNNLTTDTNRAKSDIELALKEVIPDFGGFDALPV
jgi:hypothetical protein